MIEIIGKYAEYIVPAFIMIVFIQGIREKKDILGLFKDGVIDGINAVYKLIPIIISFFFFSNIVISSGFINWLFDNILKVTNNIKYIFITFIIKMFSGSAGIALGIDTIKLVGVDSSLGIIMSIILGATETTMYVITIYLNKYQGKKLIPVYFLGIICDIFVLCITLILFIDFV